jgi:hypothetical protein
VRRFAWPANISPITATLGAMLRGDVFFLTGASVEVLGHTALGPPPA